jgi:hypothetical protein
MSNKMDKEHIQKILKDAKETLNKLNEDEEEENEETKDLIRELNQNIEFKNKLFNFRNFFLMFSTLLLSFFLTKTKLTK